MFGIDQKFLFIADQIGGFTKLMLPIIVLKLILYLCAVPEPVKEMATIYDLLHNGEEIVMHEWLNWNGNCRCCWIVE